MVLRSELSTPDEGDAAAFTQRDTLGPHWRGCVSHTVPRDGSSVSGTE